ncbi:hypothetical protein P5G50_00270 [Leifsonia sp. F6_8S_P_1B]|uniref:Uncharacterized protein n=1 Tax=Leifsonia williamsii TaxID=3035919 RepID=A0ABT8K777_9MICO|nr:hypothetical protein [Leifsonia williamsii]MDN4612868.1 hypothetical protein [Leifsonia williamsii]
MVDGFTAAELVEIRSLVLADVATSGVALGEFTLFDGRSSAGTSPDAYRVIEGDIGPTDDLFAQVDGHWMRIAADTVPDAASMVLAQLQDDIIDALGRGWPEIVDANNRFEGVAVARGESAGEPAGWYVNTRRLCAIGRLARHQ